MLHPYLVSLSFVWLRGITNPLWQSIKIVREVHPLGGMGGILPQENS